jgi:hypothetical protein
MTKYYAGIGSRSTPHDVLALMVKIARRLADDGFCLRSGHAEGADQAFEAGAAGKALIYLPWPGFQADTPLQGDVLLRPTRWAYSIAAEFHPAWDRLGQGARALQARNTHQVLGTHEGMPNSKFVVCWTPGGLLKGGTAQAMRIAHAYGIPVFNLADPVYRARLETYVGLESTAPF